MACSLPATGWPPTSDAPLATTSSLLARGAGFDFRDFAFVTPPELQALVPASRYAELKSFLKEQPEKEFDEYYDKPATRGASS